MSNVNASVNVVINTQQAITQLRLLSAEINNFNKQSFATNSAAAKQQKALSQALIDGVKTSGQFATSIVPVSSAVDNFSNSLEKNRLSLGQYTRYAGSQIPGMRRLFTREFDMINRVAVDRVKRINTQFVSLGQAANGTQRALSMMPNSLDQFAAKSAIALQRQQVFNKLLRDGSTQLLNWGKNTQWAGRQLMVGFTIPLGILGAQAAKVFRELEAEAINFKKVYGDMFTTDAEVEKNLESIKELSIEMTKYGQTAKQTMQLANTAAQSGARGAELMAATTQATRLAILGQMEQSQAIETTISLQTAFGLSNEKLAESINFLNSVENQTILSLQDVSEAIPRVASVIKGFGGDVQDLSVLLVAMKEGGVSAAEGANALKNSMARIISPTKNALEVSAKYGIALQEIVSRNDGKVVPLFQELAKVLESLGGQQRQEVLSAVFGKFQYARIGTLLSNIAKEGSQAAKAIELTGVATRDLAATAERELGAVEDSISTKFTASLEKAKIALAPVGEQFLKAVTPILDVVSKILKKFDELPGGIKTAIVAATAVIGGLAPVVLMVTGLVANGIANIAKFIDFLRKQVAILRGNGEQFKFYARAELDAGAAASSLEGKTTSLTKSMLLQKPAIESLITLYSRLAASARTAAVSMPATMGMPMAGKASGPYGLKFLTPQKRNKGGAIFAQNGRSVPGVGSTDTVPAMLTPGEFVINKESTKKNLSLIQAINSGKEIAGFNIGGIIAKKVGNLRSYLSARHGATEKRNWVDPLNSSEMRSGAIYGPGIYQSNMPGRGREYSGLADLRLAVNRDGFIYRNPRDPISIAKVLRGKGYISLDEVKARGLGTDVASYKQLRAEGYKGVTIPQGNGEVWTVDFSSKMKLASSRTPFGLRQATADWKQLRSVRQSEKRYDKANKPRKNSDDDLTLNEGGFISPTLKMNRGNVVPGMGNKDTVPALLTPGEFVINKKSTQKNLPLIEAINNGSVKGYEFGGKVSSQSKWEFAHLQDPKKLTPQQSATVRAAYPNTNFPSGNLTGYSNFAANLPPEANPRGIGATRMPANQIAAIFKDPNLTKKVMRPMITAIAKSMNISVEKALSDDKVMKSVSRVATRWGNAIEKAGGAKGMTGSEINRAISSVRITDKTIQAAIKEMKKVSSVTEIRSGRGDKRPQRKGLSATVRESIGGSKIPYKGMGMTKGNDVIPKPAQKTTPQKTQTFNRKASSTQASAKEIRKNNPRLTSAQALNLARLRERNAQKAGLASLRSYGAGGGGKPPTFLGMPAMGDPDGPGLKPSQSRMQKMSSGIGKFGMGAGMGLSMASMMPMMGANEQGKWMGMDASTAMMGMMGGGMLLSVAPMLGSLAAPILAAGAALGAIAITTKILDDNVKKAASKAADFGANLGVTANSLNTISELFGEKTPAQRSTQLQLQFSEQEQEESFGQFQNYLGSEGGQKFLKDFENLTGADRFKKLSDYLRSAISAGVLDQKTAILFAKTIGSALNDSVLGSSAIADLRKNIQESGSKGLLSLAEKRVGSAEKEIQEIAKESTVEGDFASNKSKYATVGASIQILQDYSNALALANEEFASGTISYEEFSKVATKAREAQDQWSESLLKSLTSASGSNKSRSLEVFNEEIKKIITEEQFTALAKATEDSMFDKAPDVFDVSSNRFNAVAKTEFASALASGMGADQAISLIQEIRDSPDSDLAKIFAERAGKGNALAVAAFSETSDVMAETLGLTDEMNDKFKKLGLSFLDAGGNLGQFQAFVNNLPEEIRGSMIESLSNMGRRGQQAVVATGSMGEKIQKSLLESKTYKSQMEIASGTIRVPKRGMVGEKESEEAAKNLEEINKQANKIKESLGEEIASKIIIAAEVSENKKPVDADKITKNLSNLEKKVLGIEKNFPPEILSQIDIDFTDPKEIEKWSDSSEVFAKNVNTIQQLNPNISISAVIKFLTLGADGKKLTPEEVTRNTVALNNAWKKLESSKNISVRREAMITIVRAFQDSQGNQLEEKDVSLGIKKLEDKFGGKVYKLPPDILYMSIKAIADAQGLRDQAKKFRDAAAKMPADDPSTKAMLTGKATSLEMAASSIEGGAMGSVQAALSNIKGSGGDKGGGGGGQESPLKSFLKGILDQLKMWVDASAKMADLNKAKGSFVNQVLKGAGIFDKLNNAKGINVNRLQEIMGMGPEGAQDFIKKYVKDGKLTKEGKNILDSATAAGAAQTIGENVIASRTLAMQTRAGNIAIKSGASKEVVESIAGDPKKSSELVRIQKDVENGVKGAVKAKREFIKSQEQAIKKAKELEKLLKGPIEEKIGDITKKHEENVKVLDKEIKKQEDIIEAIQQQIDKLDEKNDDDRWAIRGLERQKELIERQVEILQRANELDQKRIETLQRQDVLRNRESEALSYELDAMSQIEEKIRDSYQKRIEALDKVAEVNEYILDQERQKLGLSQALSEGDIYAATAAAQQIKQSQAEFSKVQMRSGLEKSMQNSIEGLRTSGGLTREQAEEQIRQAKEQSYQTSLLIRDIEDAIYARNQEIVPLKDQQRLIDDQIRIISDSIYNRETEIRNIRKEQLEPSQNILTNMNDQKQSMQSITDEIINQLEALGDQELGVNQVTKRVDELAQAWHNVNIEIDKANKLAAKEDAKLGSRPKRMAGETNKEFADQVAEWEQKKEEIENRRKATVDLQKSKVGLYAGGMVSYKGSNESPPAQMMGGGKVMEYGMGKMVRGYAAGKIVGSGSRDSVPAMLTPGEFVIRKAMVDKYGVPMLSKLNQGSFFMPKFSVGSSASPEISSGVNNSTEINAPVYNNYSVNVSVSNSGASADEIANKTLMKIKQMQNTKIRSGRGY
jgi:TP901 family phage tail tape measure protein